MKYFTAIALAVLMLAPVAVAAANVQAGAQTGMYWNEFATVAAQGGTGYELRGVAGDHDIRFYNANGQQVGSSSRCGNDAGTVPATAVTARIYVWDHDGALFPCASSPLDAAPATVWVYVDGL